VRRQFLSVPVWVILATALAGVVAAIALFLHQNRLPFSAQVNASTVRLDASKLKTTEGKRLQLTYEQWVALMEREAKVAAEDHPKHLTILVGDSLSLWFPEELLPAGVNWLNQGISGETSYGLLRRLKLFDQTAPETIFVMIGINDLIRGVPEETLLANQREIVRYLKSVHPKTQIVVQSILPHGGDRLIQERQDSSQPLPPWAEKLSALPNVSIRKLNQQLAEMAKSENVVFLDLHPDFLDAQDNLQAAFTTDGLHLSPQGYAVWRSRLEAFLNTTAQAN